MPAMMSCPALSFFTCSLLLFHCTSLSQDGLILLKIKKEDWIDSYKALSYWNELDQNPCDWNGIFCDTFNTVTKVNLTGASISGNLTSAICGLPNLTVLILQDNAFRGPFPNGLLRCKRLRKLDLSINELAGTLPTRISELSELRELNLGFNAFNASIPPAFGMLPRLKALFLNDNSLNGRFYDLRNLKSLASFKISNNPLLPGAVPRWLGDSRQLRELGLQNCNLVGEILDIFGSFTELEWLDMSHNHLQGNIPSSLMDLPSLGELRLNSDNLSGQIPANIHQLRSLSILDMSHNHLQSNIPSSLMDLSTLQLLDLSHNDLSGQIPANIHQLRSLTNLDLSYNALTGRIPSQLRWDSQFYFDISGNKLSGCIPDALDNNIYSSRLLPNPGLCGGRNSSLPSCCSPHNKRLGMIVVAPLFILVVALTSISLCRSCRRKPSETPSWKKTEFISTEVEESYILRNLKESNVIGSGGSGKVYKVILQNGQALAVKKIQNMGKPAGNLSRKDEHEEYKMREVEVDVLGLIRHTNIIKLLCCISSEDSNFKLLVYEFMPNGSLFDCMHGDPETEMALQWPMRHKIALGAARGLSYMHHDCSPPILHRDVKSTNILLDGDFEAKIADFGISRVLDRLGDEYMASGYVGSHGYIAPEYGRGLKVGEKSDVYSLGVVLLELVSGMEATNEAYGEGVELVQWIRNTITICGGEAAVLDCRVKEENCIEQMLGVLRVGLVCTNTNPKSRPSMGTVVQMLE